MIGCPAPNHKRTKKGHPLCNAERVGSSCACSVLPDWTPRYAVAPSGRTSSWRSRTPARS